jgi:hypothetical protein
MASKERRLESERLAYDEAGNPFLIRKFTWYYSWNDSDGGGTVATGSECETDDGQPAEEIEPGVYNVIDAGDYIRVTFQKPDEL